MIKLIVGLGNPGKKYERNRHNIGYRVIDRLSNLKLMAYNLQLFKPQTFMNNSGEEVVKKLNYYKLKANSLLVICDDIYLPLGVIRIREKGSAGGHKGLQSIIDQLKTEDFPRLRIGVGQNPENIPSEKWVLENFNADEEKIISKTIDKACKIIVEYISR